MIPMRVRLHCAHRGHVDCRINVLSESVTIEQVSRWTCFRLRQFL